jgi:iron-sulfur cluster assembly protein
MSGWGASWPGIEAGVLRDVLRTPSAGSGESRRPPTSSLSSLAPQRLYQRSQLPHRRRQHHEHQLSNWQVDGEKAVRFAGDSRSGADGTRARDLRRDTASLACFRPEPTRKEVSALLALTDSAVRAVKDIVSSSEQVPETGGLRMVAERAGTQANFQVSVVPSQAEDDVVIEEQGARVFLEPDAASLLDDKVLDASVEQDQVAFTIADQVEK